MKYDLEFFLAVHLHVFSRFLPRLISYVSKYKRNLNKFNCYELLRHEAKPKTLFQNNFLTVHCKKYKNTPSLRTFQQCQIENQRIKYEIYKNKLGSIADNFSPIGATFGVLSLTLFLPTEVRSDLIHFDCLNLQKVFCRKCLKPIRIPSVTSWQPFFIQLFFI